MSDTSKVTINYFCIGAFLIFIGSVLLCSFGFTVLLPFQTTRSWPQVECRVIKSSYSQKFCSCEDAVSAWEMEYLPKSKSFPINSEAKIGTFSSSSTSPFLPFSFPISCQAKYPCLQIFVQYQRTDINKVLTMETSNATISELENSIKKEKLNNEKKKINIIIEKVQKNKTRGSLVLNTAQLYRSWDDSFYAKCSLAECGDDVWNLKEAKRFMNDWGRIGQKFSCYFNPFKPHVTILERTPLGVVFHATFWPCLSLLAGAILWICLCAGCCKTEKKENHFKETYKTVA